MQQGNLLIAHNLDFDLGLLDREFKRAGLSPLSTETLCTMKVWRSQGMQGPAGLRDIARRLGYEFKSGKHCPLEDVCMCFRIFAYELKLDLASLDVTGSDGFQNSPVESHFKIGPRP
jgi:DNA polymerase III epsilon subunit-like protein